jgi:hypothetical protein
MVQHSKDFRPASDNDFSHVFVRWGFSGVCCLPDIFLFIVFAHDDQIELVWTMSKRGKIASPLYEAEYGKLIILTEASGRSVGGIV